MAGYKETFGANVDYAYSQAQRGKSDIANNLSQLAAAGKGATAMIGQYAAAKRSVKDLGNTMSDLRRQIENATDPRQIKKLTAEFEAARKSADNFRKSLRSMPFDAMQKGLGSVTKGLITFNANILKMGFDFLINSIKRVYELQERWTRAIGGFNMKLGGMTKGMAGATKAAVQWSSTIRGLTNGSIEEGIQMFGEFTMAMGRTVKAGDEFSKLGIQMARGFGIGGAAAGQMLKTWENIGMTANDSAEAMKTSIKAANEAGIPVNMLAEDLSKSITYMARFGKEGQKTLIQGAAWARKYDIALEQLKNSVEGFDMFDEAAKSASKLNTAFGTMINSMDLMMEDDPAKRLDMIRQQMLAQGLTYDKLSPKQRRYFSETLKLNEEQTAALLDSKNAGESYADFQAKAEKKQKQELAAKAMMQKMLVKTAQTMYAFGDAFDRVTKAIGRAIHPLLVTLGLAKDGEKEFKGFGSVMENITKTVIAFFDSLAKNDRWKDFMRELARDLQRAGSALKEFVMSGRAADLVGDIAKGMKSFYVTVRDLAMKAVPLMRPLLDAILFLSQHIDKLAIAWAGMKAFKGGKEFLGNIGDIVGVGGGGKGGKGRLGKVGGFLGKAGIAGAIGGIGGGLIGGKGAGIGSSIGGVVGSFLGPLGMALGPIVGGFIGKGIEKLFFTKGKDALTEAHESLAKTIEKENETRAAHEKMEQAFMARRKSEDLVRRAGNELLVKMEKSAQASKQKEIILGKREAEMLVARANELTLFADKTKVSKDMLTRLSEGSRISAEQLKAINDGSVKYGTALSNLRETAERLLKQQLATLEVSDLGVKKESMKMALAQAEADVSSGRAMQKAGVGQFDVSDSKEMADYFKYATKEIDKDTGGSIQFSNSIDAMIDMETKENKMFSAARAKLTKEQQKELDLSMKIRKAELFAIKGKEDLLKLETDYLKEERIIKMRNLEMGSGRFLEFQKERGIEDTAKAFETYLSEKGNELKGLYGDRGYELLSSKPTMMASGGVVTRPTKAIIGEAGPEAVIPLSRMQNLASGGSTQVVTQIAEVTLDGQKVGRALVKSTIRGRN